MSTKKWSVIFYLIVIVIALLGLLAYLPGLEFLGSVKEDYIPMAPSTSASFIVFGAAILFLINEYSFRFLKSFLLLLVLLVTVFGFLDLLGYFLGKDLNFEETFIHTSQTINGIPVARMSPATGAFFVIAGIIITLQYLNWKDQKTGKLIEYFRGWLNIILLAGGVVFYLAYIYGTPLLYNKESTIPMALTTAVAFISLSLSLLFLSKNSFPVHLFSKDTTKSYLFRYVLMLVFLSVIVSSITIYFSESLSTVNPAFVASGFTIIVLFIGAIIANIISKHLSIVIEKQKEKIHKSKKKLEKSEKKFRTLFETMTQGVVYQNKKGEIISVNPAAEKILGLTLDQMLGRTSIDPRWKTIDKDGNKLPGEKHPSMITLQTGEAIKDTLLGVFNPITNDHVWILVNSTPQFKKGSTKPFQVYSTFLNITDRRKAEMELNDLKNSLEQQVNEKTQELNKRIAELEHFHEVTIERELRMEELRQEIERLKTSDTKL